MKMADVIAVLERARSLELEIKTQLYRRTSTRAVESSAYARETVAQLARLEREVNTSIDLMCDAKAEALTYISFLTGEERAVIEGYFILAKSWQRLANVLYMSERRIFMLRKSGLDKLIRRYGDKEAI